MSLAKNLNYNLLEIESNICKHAESAGRKRSEIQIVAITKSFPSPIWEQTIKKRLYNIGENRIQETEKKINEFSARKKIVLHLIGHLQKNKAKKAVQHFDIIQTIDSIELLKKINKLAKERQKKQKVFLQVNTAKDPKKFGFDKETTLKAAEISIEYKNILLCGIMTIPPQNQSTKTLTTIYKKTKNLQEKIKNQINQECKFLSMGMSNDYEIAIKEGATHLRIGTALFGERRSK